MLQMGEESFFHEGRIGLEDFLSPRRMEQIYASQRELYWSEDWSCEFYIAQAKAGFIATSIDLGFPEAFRILLPEIQHSYAVLDWGGLHISRSMRRWMASDFCRRQGFRLEVGIDFREVLAGIHRSHPDNWMEGRYQDLLADLSAGDWDGFELLPVGLFDQHGALGRRRDGRADGQCLHEPHRLHGSPRSRGTPTPGSYSCCGYGSTCVTRGSRFGIWAIPTCLTNWHSVRKSSGGVTTFAACAQRAGCDWDDTAAHLPTPTLISPQSQCPAELEHSESAWMQCAYCR